jgi:allantoinase
MPHDRVVTGGTVVSEGLRQEVTIAIDDGRISALYDPSRTVAAEDTVDATGKHVLPGGVDPHVHMMDPGKTDREDFETGTAAAATGGITTIGEHHRTDPMVLDADVFADKREYLSAKAHVDFGLLAGGHPDNVESLRDLERAGAIAYKSFTCAVHGVPALESDAMSAVFTEIERLGGISMVHPEDELILQANEDRIRAAGRTDGGIIPEWRSREAEQVAVSTTLQIAKQTGVSLWLAHLSHPAVVDQVTHARNSGVDVYAECCPQYLYLTEEDVVDDAPYTMFTPPARSADERAGLWDRLAAGDIHMINADHAPSTREQKAAGEENVFEAPFGIPGVETVLPLLLNGVHEGKVSLERVVEVFATNPAKITGLYPQKGTLRVGSDADLVIVDMNQSMQLTDDGVVAKCGWTPFDGMDVVGVPESTLVRGNVVVDDGVVGEPGYGEFVSRGQRTTLGTK